MSWLFSRALVEEFSLASSAAIAQSAPSSETPTPQAYLSPDKMMEFSSLSPSGMTCAPLTDAHGADWLTSFLAASHARTSAAREIEPVLPGNAPVSGASSRAWFVSLNPGSFEWRTPQISLLGDLELFSETWPRSGSMRNGTCYLRPTLVPTICVSGSGSLLPTLTVKGNNNRPYPGKKSGYGLATAIALLPTLTTIGLNGGSKSRAATARRGEPPTHVGPLNPDWCEWFMGFPIGWTVFAALAMPKFHAWQQQHSPLSHSNSTEEQAA